MASTELPRPIFFDPSRAIVRSRGGSLPHWHQPNCACFVTWRTADSLPQEMLSAVRDERAEWLRAHPEPWSAAERSEYAHLFEGRMQVWLDAGHGACVFERADLRKLVEDAILRFDGERYVVYAFVVMPNHVHVLFMPLGEETAGMTVCAWKGVSSHAVNQALGKSGSLWQKESWDHLVRNKRQFAKFVHYIRNNNPAIAYSVYDRGEA